MPSGSSISLWLSPTAAFALQGSGSAAGASSATSTASSFGGVVKRVTPSSRRQRYTKLRSTSCRRSTSVTVTPCPSVSETIRSLISADQFRRRSTPLRTSIRSTDTWLSSLQTLWLNATRQTQRFNPHSARRPSPDAYDASVMPPSPPRPTPQFDAGARGAGGGGALGTAAGWDNG